METNPLTRSARVVLGPAALLIAVWLCGCDAAPDGVHDAGGHPTADAAPELSDADNEVDPNTPWPTPSRWELAVDGDPGGALMNVWGPPDGAIWTVGGQLSTSTTSGARLVLERSDEGWVPVEVPAGPMLNWVHGADGLAWIVGEAGRALRFEDGVFVEEVQTPTERTLWGVWCASRDACWSVGGDPRSAESTPAMLEWNGNAWRVVDLPPPTAAARALFKVWGTGPTDVHAIGSLGTAYHFDGAAWREVPTGVSEDLISLWGRAPNDVIAVGGRIRGVLGRWNGSAWTFERPERTPGLNGAWMAHDGQAVVVGVSGSIGLLEAGAMTPELVENPVGTVLHGVWGRPDGVVVGVGGTLDRPLPWTGTVVEGH